MFSVLFRVDASQQIGAGHLMRCLALADSLHAQGGKATFISSPLSDAYRDLLASRKHTMLEINGVAVTEPGCSRSSLHHAAWLPWGEEEDVNRCMSLLADSCFDWLVVDHYALSAVWENAMRNKAHRVMVIDDLADRDHDCDLLLDQNFGRMVSHYKQRVGSDTHLLIDPKYALLRPEFSEQRAASLSRREVRTFNNLLISLGAVDKDNHTATVLRSLSTSALPPDTKVIVVLGAEAPHVESVKAEAAQSAWCIEVLLNVSDMAKAMSKATWAIGAAGTSTWERCCLGLPTLTLVVADNQLAAARALSEGGYIVLADPLIPLEVSIPLGIGKLISHAQEIACRCAEVTDGRGVERVLRVMEELGSK